MWSKEEQEMNDYLDSKGLFRKHIAKDGSCLFRIVSEHVYNTQSRHETLRRMCVFHIKKHRENYESFIEKDFDEYLDNLRSPTGWAGHVEMNALANIFEKTFVIYYDAGRPPYCVTDNATATMANTTPACDAAGRYNDDAILLCFSQQSHYDSVYPKSLLLDSAVCQSIVYETLYKRVFKLGDVQEAVQKMLHDKNYFKHKKNMTFEQWKESLKGKEDESLLLESEESGNEIRLALAHKIPPFPFKVAKALDPGIYRNVQYDLWNEVKKEQLRNEQLVIPEFAPGVKCLVRLSCEKSELLYAHIQEMMPEQGPVTVFVEKLGELRTVPFENLEPLPVPAHKVLTWKQGISSGKFYSEYYIKHSFNSGFIDKFKSRRKFFRRGKFKDFSLFISPVHGSNPFRCGMLNSVSQPKGQCHLVVPGQTDCSGLMADTQYNSNETDWQTENSQEVCKSLGVSMQMANPQQPWSAEGQFAVERYAAGGLECIGQEHFVPADSCHVSATVDSVVNMPCDIATSGSQIVTPVENAMNMFITSSSLSADIASNLCVSSAVESFSPPPPNCPTPPLQLLSPEQISIPLQPFCTSTPCPATPTPPPMIPCNQLPGMIIPLDATNSINFSASKSQDPLGKDLPLGDIQTLRFFYNLGCDYFRMTTQPVMLPAWNYNGSFSFAVIPAPPETTNPFSTPEGMLGNIEGTPYGDGIFSVSVGSPPPSSMSVTVGSPEMSVPLNSFNYRTTVITP